VDLATTGYVHEGRSEDGRVFRVLELPGQEPPEVLTKALGLSCVAQGAATKRDDARVLVALRPAPGPTLEWILRRQEALSLHALSLSRALCELFQAVHDARLCFRAIAPSMFAVGPDGTICLEEPEMLRLASEPPARASTPFAAPEVAAGAEGGERADQYGLGALVYCLLTGRLPADRGDFPLARIFRPQLPHGAVTALGRAMAPRPADRYESCRAFGAELAGRTMPRGASPTVLSVAAATELGRLKGQAMPVNQDAFYVGMDAASRRGLLLVADGVSTADVGSGDLASAWSATRSRAPGRARSARSCAPTRARCRRSGPRPRWRPSSRTPTRASTPSSSSPSSSARSARDPPAGSTAVLGVLDGDRLTLANIGDSRLYLLRDGALARADDVGPRT
jgi:serine/threonine-protein kinase